MKSPCCQKEMKVIESKKTKVQLQGEEQERPADFIVRQCPCGRKHRELGVDPVEVDLKFPKS